MAINIIHGHCSPRGGRNQGEVLACSEKGTLQSVNSDMVVHKQSIAQKSGRPLTSC